MFKSLIGVNFCARGSFYSAPKRVTFVMITGLLLTG
nr:MAG TPA: hypothetical protein [Caudoviricetes sp.]DAT18745.1 MAG TPA: hypothetical protein [Caudoviricetes sp.]